MLLCYLPGMTKEVPSARRDIIKTRLSAGQTVASSALAEEFGVSEDAIRRDLRAFAAEGFCRRVYGGALPLEAGSTPMAVRETTAIPEKRALAAAAVSLLAPGSFLFLDNGSTNLLVAEALPRGHDFVVATNSVAIASALIARGDVDLLMVGGAVDPVVGGCVDAGAIDTVSRLNIDTCFLGACTLSGEGGVSAFEGANAAFKRVLVSCSARTFVLATNDKLGGRSPHRIVALDRIERIIVEHDAAASAVETLEAAGAAILRTAPPSR